MTSISTRLKNLSHKFVNLAYKADNQKKFKEELKIAADDVQGTGWQFLSSSLDQESTNQYGYKAAAFVNHDTKTVLIASAGTKANKYDLYDDALITFGYTPYKLEPLKEFTKIIIDSLGGIEKAQKYEFNTSGHSLGAIVADLTAANLLSYDLKVGKSTTFDSPGSRPVVKYAIEQNLLANKLGITTLEELAEICEVYNAKPNVINTTNNHLGEVNLVLPVKSESKVEAETLTGVWGFAKYLTDTVGSVIGACSDYLGVNKLFEGMNNHKLANFNSLDITPKFKIDGDWNNKPILNTKDPKVSAIDRNKSTGYDVAIIDEEYISGDGDLPSLIGFELSKHSFDDLREVGLPTLGDVQLIADAT